MILIKGGRVIAPHLGLDEVADLVVDEHACRLRRDDSTSAAQQPDVILEARGLLVLPGLIDMHVHLREPGHTDKETIATGTRAAAAGGFTLVAAEANTDPPIDSEARLGEVYELIERSAVVPVMQKPCLTKGQRGRELARVDPSTGAPVVSDDGEPLADADLLLRALAWCKSRRLVPCLHEEETEASREALARVFGPGKPYAREAELIARDIGLAAEADAPVHFCHVSLAESARLIREAQKRGVAVTAEATPHHLCLSEDDVPRRDPNFKMNPPLRSREDVQAIRRALAEGVIGVIASDHAPHTPEEKARAWDSAPFGVIGLETSLGVVMTRLVGEGVISLSQMVGAMHTNPSRLLRLGSAPAAPDSRRVGEGSLTLIDPDREWTVDAEQFYSKGRNCPFAGWRLKGKAVAAIVRGKLVMRDGEILV